MRFSARLTPLFSRISLSSKIGLGVGAGALLGYHLQPPAANAHSTSSCCTSSNLRDEISTLSLDKAPKLQYANTQEYAEALTKITKVVGDEYVNVDKDVLEQHSDSAWQFYHAKPGEVASAVVFPENTEQVSEVLKIAHKYRVPVTAYSGGTSLEGQFTPVYQGISLDLNRMNKIVAVHKNDLDCTVQPTVGWEELNDVLDDYGLVFGIDPGPGAAIGGLVNTCASGTKAYRYGPMRQNIVGLQAVLADGTIVRTRRRPRKSSAGYSLSDLLCGSEGTLAVVTEITVKCHPKPAFSRVGAISFPTIKEAANTVERILLSGRQLDAMELMDSDQMRMLNNCGITSRKWKEDNTLLVRFGGPSVSRVEEDINAVLRLAKENSASDMVFAETKEEGDELWAARKNALYSLLHSSPEGYHTFGTDTAVPLSQLSKFVDETREEIKKWGLLGSVLGHVGDGNFHVSIAYDPKTELEKVEDFAYKLAQRSIELEGTCTGEHGVGMGKRELLLEELGDPAIDMMRKIKYSLDPHFILNPGKIFKLEENEKQTDWTRPQHSGCQCH